MYSQSPGTTAIVKTEGYQKAISHSSRREYELNSIVKRELGDISGKKLLHLQCNTGADSILLARMGAEATGVDLVPENVHFAGMLAQELGVDDVSFVISDIMELMDTHEGKYNIVFTSDGVIGGYASETKECKNFYWMRSEEHTSE